MFESDIFNIVADVDKSPCYLCARMRRGYLYSHAKELGCNKIALGHHFDDVIETTLMGMLYSGKVETMMPKLHSKNFEGMELIRPMYMVREADIKAGGITTTFTLSSAPAASPSAVRPAAAKGIEAGRDEGADRGAQEAL